MGLEFLFFIIGDYMYEPTSITMINMYILNIAMFFIPILVSSSGQSLVHETQATSYCNIKWLFATDCGVVSTSLSHAILDWIEDYACGTSPRGEDCEYISVIFNQTARAAVKGIHISFPEGFVSDFGLQIITMGEACRVAAHGFTTKDVVTDPDFNYCTLNELIFNSELPTTYGYTQTTDGEMCPESLIANCS